ncbi:MAG TPA: hypothetical protein VNZ61_23540 [Roseomonas sp.]|nr:hypothetical protein [Roseomonas sp.]
MPVTPRRTTPALATAAIPPAPRPGARWQAEGTFPFRPLRIVLSFSPCRPAASPRPLVGKLAPPAVPVRLAGLGAEARPGGPETLETFIAADRTRWRAVPQAAQVKLE